MNAGTYLEWTHPIFGEIGEPLCTKHRREVINALAVLGIGCTGQTEKYGRDCFRCNPMGRAPREWIRAFALIPDSEEGAAVPDQTGADYPTVECGWLFCRALLRANRYGTPQYCSQGHRKHAEKGAEQ